MEDFASTLDAARAGDRSAFDILIHANLPTLRAHVRLQLGTELRGKESASDLIQEVLSQVLADLKKFRGDDERVFRAWLLRLASRKLGDRRAYWMAGRRAVHRETEELSDDAEIDLRRSYSSMFTPSRIAIARETNRKFEAVFDELTDDQKQAITLSCFGGLSHREIAQELGRSETACRMLLNRARATIAMRLADADM